MKKLQWVIPTLILLVFLGTSLLTAYLSRQTGELRWPALKLPVGAGWGKYLDRLTATKKSPPPEPLSASPTATPVSVAAGSGSDYQDLLKINADLQTTIEKDKEIISSLENQVAVLEKTLQQIDNPTFNYTGEDLFAEVNRYRRENNLGELAKDYHLCYLASFRLNQLLEIGKLDNHKGFDDFNPAEKFKYEIVGENLAQGYTTASDTVFKGWAGSPGHHMLLTDARLTLGCTAANRGIAVLIAGREH